MNAQLWKKVALGASVAAAALGASAQLSTTASGPYYATPSWDQKLTISRFVVLANWGNQAVLDRETGLVWHRSFILAGNLPAAFETCGFSTVGGRRGWRLPTMPEMFTLTEADSAASILPAGHPFEGVPPLFFVPSFVDFYTATQALVSPFSGPAYRTFGYAKVSADTLTMSRGLVSPQNPVAPGYVLCVRGGGQDGPL